MSEPSPHIVFLKTSTVEKITHFQMIADAKGLPIIFADVRDIAGTQHATDELEGSVEGNANAKFKEFGNIPQRMKTLGDPMHENVVEMCNKYGTDYDPKRIHVAVDDFEWGIESLGARSLATTDGFTRYVGEDTLDRAVKSATFPGPELAPFISAMSGNSAMLRGLQTGIADLLPDAKTVPSAVSVVFQYQTLADLDKEPEALTGKSTLIFDAKQAIKVTDTVKDLSKTLDGVAATSPEFFLHKHPRTDVLKAFVEKHLPQYLPQFIEKDDIKPTSNWERKVKTTELTQIKETDLSGDTLHADDPRKSSFLKRMREAHEQGQSTNIVDFAAQMRDTLRKADEILAQTDALVFMPSDASTAPATDPALDIAAITRQFMLSSCVVAKQLNLRDANKPFIVLNHKDKEGEEGKGSYDKDFEIFDYLAQNGMMKDYTLGLETVKPEGLLIPKGVTYRKTLYFDLLEGTDLSNLQEAKNNLLEHYKQTYYKPPALTMQDNTDLGAREHFVDAVAKGQDIFKVGVFLSAGSENLQLNQDTKDFGRWLAGNGYGIVYGGGDRYLMGSLHDGYNEGRVPEEHSSDKTFEAGFSTPEIVKSETKEGVLPTNMDVSILNKDIYERMAQMIALTDDAIIIRPGGAGTVQELAAVLLMKEVYKDVPEIARKKIIIQNPPLIDGQEPFYDRVLERLFGEKYQTLKEESKPGSARSLSDKLGIYIANDDEQIKSLLEDLKGEWQRRQLHSSDGSQTSRRSARI